MKKKLLGILIALGICIPAYASIAVAPTRVEIDANKIRSNYATTAIEIKGDKEKPMRFRVYPGYFTIDNNSKIVVKAPKGEPADISGKIRFVPSEFTVPPGKSQKLRINIANIKGLPDGESRAILYIEDVENKEMNVPNEYGIGAKLVLKTRVGVPVYVDKGKYTKSAEIQDFQIVKEKDGLYTQITIKSTGNSRIRFNGSFQVIEGRKLIDEYDLIGNVVGVGNTYVAKQKIDTSKIKNSGDYTLRMIFHYFDEKGVRKNIKKDAILKITGEI